MQLNICILLWILSILKTLEFWGKLWSKIVNFWAAIRPNIRPNIRWKRPNIWYSAETNFFCFGRTLLIMNSINCIVENVVVFSVFVLEFYRFGSRTHFFGRNFIKVMYLLKESLKCWFGEKIWRGFFHFSILCITRFCEITFYKLNYDF